MSVGLSLVLNGWRGFLPNGTVNSGGFIYTYLAGTSTPATTYTTSSGLIANSNPIVLNSGGLPSSGGSQVEIWLTVGVSYKFVVFDSLMNQVEQYDNITGDGATSYNVATFSALGSTAALYAGQIVNIQGHTTIGIGGGDFEAISGSVTSDGGTQINSITPGFYWKRVNYLYPSVQFWGVIGDGVADDTTACQLAINSGFKELYWPAGTYNINANGLTGVTGQKWVGAGAGSTTIKATVTPNADFIYFPSKNTIEISNITFDGNGFLTSTTNGHFAGLQPCIYFSACNSFKVHDCQFIGFYTSALFGNACHEFSITDNYVTRSTAIGSIINYGINFSGSVGNETYNGTIARNTLVRCDIAINAFDVVVTENNITGWAFSSGIDVVASGTCYRNIISNNVIYNPVQAPDKDGFFPCCIENWGHDSVISGNVCFGAYGDGIENGGKNVTITGNNSFLNNGSGIYNLYFDATYNASGATVSGNNCNGNQQYGIKEQSASLTGINMAANSVAGNVVGRYNILGTTNYDDEGTTTLTIVGGTTPGTQTYSLNAFEWIRNGRMVTIQGRIALSALTGTGQVRISNLPFPARNSANVFGSFAIEVSGTTTTFVSLVGIINQGQSYITVNGRTVAAVGGTNVQMSDIAIGTTFTFSCTYLV